RAHELLERLVADLATLADDGAGEGGEGAEAWIGGRGLAPRAGDGLAIGVEERGESGVGGDAIAAAILTADGGEEELTFGGAKGTAGEDGLETDIAVQRLR